MIKVSESSGAGGDNAMKVEEYLGNVEATLLAEAQRILGVESVDQWIKRLNQASAEPCEEEKPAENKFITGVPRDQKWVRVEPNSNLTAEKIKQIAKDCSLSTNQQKDERLLVYGQQEALKEFLKKMTAETTRKP